MSSDAPPAKRARTDDDAPSTPIRSDIWHYDGSVVLQAANTQFRVHWSVLTMHSSVFKDMYSVPQPDVAGPTVENCPVVELHDDPQDLEYVLKALYDPTLLSQQTLSFDIVSALVRLGRKYDFKNLRKAGTERLLFENPRTLDEFDALQKRGGTPRRVEYQKGYRFDVVNLLQDADIPSGLPHAYYQLVCTSPHTGMGHVRRSDGTYATLTPADMSRVALATQKLHNAQFRPGYTLSWLHELSSADQCSSVQSCAEIRFLFLQQLVTDDTLFIALFTCPEQLTGLKSSFCARCANNMTEKVKAGRQRAWDELPGFFGLPSWDELKQSDEL
ncbi:BTB domain-containing protein [Mycena chlorophos]|uniref:BTB domain-containing protein n=1 Tax=Mycena chlorophos TaxID=658473 RepID=A0A8H6SEF5_MYCCL|nr:BTB domain-containing protein [Mycena chlorophos]